MPKWTEDSLLEALPRSAGDPFDRFVSELPPGEIWEAGAVSQAYQKTVDELPLRQIQNFGVSSKASIARLATTIGIPDYVIGEGAGLGPLGQLLTVDPLDFRSKDVRQAALQQLVHGTGIEILQTALSTVGSAVPIVGALAQFALFLAQSFRAALREVEADPPPPTPTHKALAYSQGADEHDTEQRLRDLKVALESGEPLTRFFLPFVNASSVRTTGTYTERGPWGTIATMIGPKRDGAWGHIPGTPDIGDFVQYPQAQKPSEIQVGRGSPTGYSGLHPSVAQFGTLLWQMIIKNGPLAFQIDGNAIADAWEDWFAVLNGWAAAGTGREGRHRWAMVSQLSTWALSKSGGGVRSNVEGYAPARGMAGGISLGGCGSGEACVPFEYVRWIQSREQHGSVFWKADRGPFIRYLVHEQWRSQLANFLRTITCAYVPYGAPALKVDLQLADLHRSMRQRLLSHSAVRIVDATIIPDGFYRSKVITAQRSASGDVAIAPPDPSKLAADALAGLPPQAVQAVQAVPPVDPGGLVLAPRSLAPAVPRVDLDGDTAAAIVVLLAAGGTAAAAAWYLLRGRRRRWA